MDTMKRFAFVFGIAGVLCLVAGFTTAILNQSLDTVFVGWMGASVLSFLFYSYLDASRITDTMQSRAFAYSSGSSMLLILAALIATFGFFLADRYDHTWDVTRDQQFTLSEQTVNVLSNLEEEVTLVAFFREGTAFRSDFEQLVKRAQNHTNLLDVRFYDPLRNPLMAEQYGIETESSVVFEQGDRTRILDHDFDEKGLTRTLVLLRSDVDHQICWSLGHGEPDPDDVQDPKGLGAIVVQLEELNYQVTKQFILTEGISRDCEALVIASPMIDWFPYEREALAAYLAEGGRVFLLADPLDMSEILAEELERYGIRTRADIVVDLDPKNMMMNVNDPSHVTLSDENLGAHPITKGLAAAIVLPIARSLEPLQVEGLFSRTLLTTSEEAWGETEIENLPNIAPGPDEVMGPVPVMLAIEVEDPAVLEVSAAPDTAAINEEMRARMIEAVSFATRRDPSTIGPEDRLREDLGAGDADLITMAAGAHTLFGVDIFAERNPDSVRTVQDLVDAVIFDVNKGGGSRSGVPGDFTPTEGGRLVVIGDVDFVSNRHLMKGNNKDLFLNTIAWLVEENDQLGARPISGDKLEIGFVGETLLCLVSTIFVPGLTLSFALLTLVRRRYL